MFDPKKCGLYKPGHQTHFIQAKVMREKPRFPAEVELISKYSLRVKTEVQDEILYYHDAVGLHLKYLAAFEGNILYSPESKILWVFANISKEPFETTVFPAYLSESELTACAATDPDSGYFRVTGGPGEV